MADLTKTKYTGVYYRDSQSDRVFYITYKKSGKKKWEKVGSRSEGITAAYCNKVRAKQTSIERLGDEAPLAIEEKSKKKTPTINEVANQYLESLKDLSDYGATVGRYNNHLIQTFGKKLLTELSSKDIENFIDKKKKEVSFKTGRPYANKTINDMINLLNAIYNYAAKSLEIEIQSPAKSKKKKEHGKGIIRLTEDNARQRYLTLEEIETLYNGIENRAELLKIKVDKTLTTELLIFTKLALCTGARMSSLLNMRKRDFKLSERIVTVKDLKNDSTYTGYLSEGVVNLLNERFKNITPNDCVIGCTPNPKHRVGINKGLQPILNKLFNEGLDVDDSQNRVVIHSLRHTFGSLLAIQGTPIYTIQKLMNHKSIDMTMRYAKLAPDQGKEAVMRLSI